MAGEAVVILAEDYDLKPTPMEDGSDVYGVKLRGQGRHAGSVKGWIRRLPMGGWQRYGYEDRAPVLHGPQDAVTDLIEYDSFEQDTTPGPPVVG